MEERVDTLAASHSIAVAVLAVVVIAPVDRASTVPVGWYPHMGTMRFNTAAERALPIQTIHLQVRGRPGPP